MDRSSQRLGSVDKFTRASPVTVGILELIQSLTRASMPRGLPRLLWLLRHFLIGRRPTLVRFRQQFWVTCEPSDMLEVMAVFGIAYAPLERVLKDIRTAMQPHKKFVLFDVGANVGFVALMASGVRGDTGGVAVHCFEPNPLAYERLVTHIAVNGLKHQLNHVAVGRRPGVAVLSLGVSTRSSTLVPGGLPYAGSVGQVDVVQIALDSYCQQNAVVPHAIKIDVEGWELEVLEGASETIMRYRPMLIIELNTKALRACRRTGLELLQRVRALGYTPYHVDPSAAQLRRHSLSMRPAWRSYREVFDEDAQGDKLFDLLCVPKLGIGAPGLA